MVAVIIEKIFEKYGFVKESQMYISVLLCSLQMLILGCNAAWTSPLLLKLNGTDDNPLGTPLTESEYSLLCSLGIPGGLIGAFLMGIIAHVIGRKPLLTILALPNLYFYLSMAFTKTVWSFLVAIVIQGIGFGGIYTILSMYICEISEPELRGRLNAVMGVTLSLGQLITYCLGPYMSFKWYHISISIIPLLFMILFHFFGTESPYYLLQKNPDEAERVLRILRGTNDVSEEFNEMKRGLHKTSEGTLLDVLKTRGTRKAFVIGLGMSAFTILTGGLIIIAYTTFIFNEAGGSWSGDVESIAIGVVQLVSSLCASLITDRFGRKPLLTIAYIGVALSEGVLGYYFILKDSGSDVSRFGWIPLFCLTAYSISQNISIVPLYSAIMGEIFPLRVKGVAISFCGIFSTGLGFVSRMLFRTVIGSIGLGQTFLGFAAAAVLASIFVAVILVETRGKTLEEIQDELNGNKRKDLT